MLSYLKDGNQLPASADMMPDGDSPASSTEDYLTVSDNSQKLRRGTMTLIILFAVGGLGLWLMAKKTTPASASAEPSQNQAQLENVLAQLNSMRAEMDLHINSVAGRFDLSDNTNQVSVNELKKNPFVRKDFSSKSSMSTDGSPQQREEIEHEAQIIAMSMELWSITSTPKGLCCMIDDKVLYQGDVYRNMMVKALTSTTVTLEYQGIPIELKMEK